MSDVANQVAQQASQNREVEIFFRIAQIVVPSVLAFVLGRWSVRRDSRSGARAKFQAAFAEVRDSQRQLRGHGSVVRDSIGAHEAAIAEFRHHVSRRRRASFDAACETYRKCRRPVEAGEVLGSTRESERSEFLHAIEDLLSYADKT